jgi:putative transposase
MTENERPGRRRRRYTPEQRQQILRDADALGVGEAARRHQIPESTVFNWRHRMRLVETASGHSTETRQPTGPTVGKEGADDVESALEPPTDSEQPSRLTAKRYTPSEKARALELAAAEGVSEASRKLGISRFAIQTWRRQAKKAARGEGPSPTSGPPPAEIDAQRDREILAEWKQHPGLGPSQVRNQLRRRGIKVAVQTVRRVMEDAGYRPPKVKREPHDQRYEAVRPNHLWHMDFVHRYINRATTFTLILIDDHSRFVVGHGVDDAERAAMVIETFEEAVRRHGKPEAVMHDRGAAFWSWRGISKFTALLTELGVDQIVAEKKEHNGKVENFNGNLHKELFDRYRFCDVTEMRRRLAAHLHWFNHARTHHALGGLLVPADRYHGRADEVIARIESGIGREPGEDLDLRDRCLELFKVVSREGATEVWLMGRRLLKFASGE